MKFLSVCSGIEAASSAWRPLGWEAVAFSEIEPFPCSVLAHHYPDTPNWGDMTKYKEWPDVSIDLLCGGTPCQSFSVAGLRKGLDDPRGNLMLTFGAIAAKYRPKWLVWENVYGVLSSNGGRDFGSFLGLLGVLGYGFAYRVLDAQYFGVAQRRRRVFVVGCLGDWRSAAAVLFERHSLSGHPAPSREKGKVAPTIPSRSTAGGGLGTDFDLDGGTICVATEDLAPSMGSANPTGVAYTTKLHNTGSNNAGKIFKERTTCLDANSPPPALLTATMVRRLTAVECERLQGFEDNHTAVPWRGKPADQCPDGNRYKSIGNSWAVPCARWIGERIEAVQAVNQDSERAAA